MSTGTYGRRLPARIPARLVPPPLPMPRKKSRHMANLITAIAVAVPVLLIGMAILMAGKSSFSGNNANSSKDVGGATWGSPYTVKYRPVPVTCMGVCIEITVKGPANELAVILTLPDGKFDTQFIGKESMINNCQIVYSPMGIPQDGTYVLAIKTINPEKVVWQKNITFSPAKLTAEDVKIELTKSDGLYGPKGGYFVGVDIVVKKNGDLPIVFNRNASQLMVDNGRRRVDFSTTFNGVICEQGASHIYFSPGDVFEPGHKGVVNGKIFFNGNNSFDFKKEFTAPGK